MLAGNLLKYLQLSDCICHIVKTINKSNESFQWFSFFKESSYFKNPGNSWCIDQVVRNYPDSSTLSPEKYLKTSFCVFPTFLYLSCLPLKVERLAGDEVANNFQNSRVIEAGLPDFHKMTASIMKMKFEKLQSRMVHYTD